MEGQQMSVIMACPEVQVMSAGRKMKERQDSEGSVLIL